VDYLHSQVAACDVFLAVIGPNWLNAKDDDGRRRFDNPDDFVTIEIAAALARNIRVIPVLVDGARTPKVDKLPDSVKPLVRRNAVEVRNTHFGRDAEALINKVREALKDAPGAPRRLPLVASAAARLMAPGRWRMVAGSATALLLVGWIGLYQMGVPVWLPWTPRAEQPDAPNADKAKAAAEAEAKRKAEEAEHQRLAAIKEEEQRQAKAPADAEAKRMAAEYEQQRLAVDKEDEERKAKAAAEAEAQRKAWGAEQQRRVAALTRVRPLGCQPVLAASDRLRFDIDKREADGLKAIQVKAWGSNIRIEDIVVDHVGDFPFALGQKGLFIAYNTASAPIRLENDTKPLSSVLVTYSSATRVSSAPASLCIEGLKE
jgi:hypothetical protein